MKTLSNLMIYALMGLMTFGYTCTIRLGLGIFNILYDPGKMGALSTFAHLTASQSMIDLWQYLAWGSFLISVMWGMARARHGDFPEPHATPWVCHLTLILCAFFLNVTGALSPFVMPVYVIQ